MDEILSIIVCAVIGVLFTWITERGKRDRSRAEANAAEAHDDHRERVRRHAPPLPVPPVPQAVESSIPEEGVRVTPDQPVDTATPHHSAGTDNLRQKNARQRWRQAIIDSEIMTRKY